eukprot:2837411-Amphidinium_carterae.1
MEVLIGLVAVEVQVVVQVLAVDLEVVIESLTAELGLVAVEVEVLLGCDVGLMVVVVLVAALMESPCQQSLPGEESQSQQQQRWSAPS